MNNEPFLSRTIRMNVAMALLVLGTTIGIAGGIAFGAIAQHHLERCDG